MKLRIIIAALVALLLIDQAEAASIKIWSNDTLGAMRIEGKIEVGDAKEFYEIVKATHKSSRIFRVELFSPGGNVYEAMKIGMMVRHLMMETVVPFRFNDEKPFPYMGHEDDKLEDESNNTCDSACFFIFAGGVVRSGTWVRVHRPTLDPEIGTQIDYGTSSNVVAEVDNDIDKYLRRMQVPSKIQDAINSTPSYELLLLDEEIMKSMGVSPNYEEWLVSKCGADYLNHTECISKAVRESSLKAREAFEGVFEQLFN
jgi:hypothetical protein